MSFPRYPEYKDSGVEWLGQLPSHWVIDCLKHRCEVFPSNVDKHSREDEHPVLLCNYTDVYYNEVIAEGISFMPSTAKPEQIEKFRLRRDDVIITKDSESADDIAVAAYVPQDLPGVLCGYHLSMIRPRESTSGAFVKRLFDSKYAKARFEVSANGLTRVGLGQYALDNVKLPFPPHSEQIAIANFLDHETAKIDALIAEQEKLIELLKEKRQAVISHAVTKGLDPNVKMKDSGVEWLGQVPEHWEVMTLRRIVGRIESGVSVNAIDEPVSEGEIGVLKTSCVYTHSFDHKENKKVVSEELERVSCPVTENTVIVSRMNTPDLVGAAGFVSMSLNNLFLPDRLWAVHFERISPKFVYQWFCSNEYRCQVAISCAGTSSSMQNISQDSFLNFFLAVPPSHEQEAICRFLENTLAQIDRLIEEVKKGVVLFQERRSALISAAVTGQIDVRNFVPEAEPA